MHIYTLGAGTGRKQISAVTIQAIVNALNIDMVRDWRPKAEGRLSSQSLTELIGEKYSYVGDRCRDE